MLRVSEHVVDYAEFTLGAKAADVGQKHAVMKVVHNDSGKRYFLKREKEIGIAQREVNIMEIQRLLYHPNPVTMLVVNHKEQLAYVASNEVNKFTSLQAMIRAEGADEIANRINAGFYTGLGQIMVLALLSGEADLHMNNIGINALGQFVRIDGDWSQARMRFGEDNFIYKFAIDESTISQLPKMDTNHFMPYNWFDQIRGATISDQSAFLDNLDPAALRQDINEQLLKCMLVPDDFYLNIINHQIITQGNKSPSSLSTFLELSNARAQLFKAACLNPGFQQFMLSPNAVATMQAFKEDVKNYQMPNSTLPIGESINTHIDDRFALVQRLSKVNNAEEFMKFYATTPDILAEMPVNENQETPFMIAVKSSDKELAKAIYNKVYAVDKQAARGAINQPDANGYTPVMMAAKVANRSLFNYLRKTKKADMHATAKNGYNVLLVATAAGNLYAVRKAIKVLDINSVSNSGSSALIIAARSGHLDIVKYLLKNKAKDLVGSSNKSAVVQAIENGHGNIAEFLLQKINIAPEQLNLALIAAAKRNHEELALKILQSTSLVVGTDADNRTALSYAASNGMSRLVAKLIPKMNIDAINHQQNNGNTALIEAVKAGDADCIKTIVTIPGVKYLSFNESGDTAISLLASSGEFKLAHTLLKNLNKSNAIINNTTHETIMHYAARAGNLAAVVQMNAEKVSITYKNADGRTPFHEAIAGGHHDIVTFFIERSCNPFRADNNGISPFLLAASMNDTTSLRLILARCAPPELELTNALKLAVDNHNKESVKLLIAYGADVNKAYLSKEVDALLNSVQTPSKNQLNTSTESSILSKSAESYASASASASPTDNDPTPESMQMKARSAKSHSGGFGLFDKENNSQSPEAKTAEFRSNSKGSK